MIDLHKAQYPGASPEDRDDDVRGADFSLTLSRERCLSVVHGLMALLLSMDFTCHVDLFLIACKVYM